MGVKEGRGRGGGGFSLAFRLTLLLTLWMTLIYSADAASEACEEEKKRMENPSLRSGESGKNYEDGKNCQTGEAVAKELLDLKIDESELIDKSIEKSKITDDCGLKDAMKKYFAAQREQADKELGKNCKSKKCHYHHGGFPVCRSSSIQATSFLVLGLLMLLGFCFQ